MLCRIAFIAPLSAGSDFVRILLLRLALAVFCLLCASVDVRADSRAAAESETRDRDYRGRFLELSGNHGVRGQLLLTFGVSRSQDAGIPSRLIFNCDTPVPWSNNPSGFSPEGAAGTLGTFSPAGEIRVAALTAATV